MDPEPTRFPMAPSVEWTEGYTCRTQVDQSGALSQEFGIGTQGLQFTDAQSLVCIRIMQGSQAPAAHLWV